MSQTEEKIVLPEAFKNRMKSLLGEEYPAFLDAYEKKRLYGLRFNPLKTSRDSFIEKMPFSLKAVAWTPDGFYYEEAAQPGKHILHEAGAYYIQEPSAMAVVEALSPKPGEKILDLCAAPGGKSTHIAGKMYGKGLLVSNEIVPARAKVLSQNIERMGIANAVVCNEPPEKMAEHFPQFFDRILVDAPCSGEGMFRKDETAIHEWSPENVVMCAKRQRFILEQAAIMLRPGGTLVYSTCTFSPEENEGVISGFLREHSDFSMDNPHMERFFSPGKPEWVENPAEGIEYAMRLWPHKLKGEGHFIARLKKEDGLYASSLPGIEENVASRKKGQRQTDAEDVVKQCANFLREELKLSPDVWERWRENGVFSMFGEHLYLIPAKMIPLQGLSVLRPGLHLGTQKKNRFEPAHALARYLSDKDAGQCYELTAAQALSYLQGETFACDTSLKGWMVLTTDGYTLGFGKAGNGQMKNHYPKGLRK